MSCSTLIPSSTHFMYIYLDLQQTRMDKRQNVRTTMPLASKSLQNSSAAG